MNSKVPYYACNGGEGYSSYKADEINSFSLATAMQGHTY
jgi:hypothetical protein